MGVDFKNLTREDAIKLHREMWNTIAQHEESKRLPITPARRGAIKETYLYEEHQLDNQAILHNCFLCEYAFQTALKEDNSDDVESHYCKHCPLDWKKNESRTVYMCESTHFYDGTEIDWRYSTADIIANLEEKKTLEE